MNQANQQLVEHAERSALGAMLNSADAVTVALGSLTAEDFHDARHQVIFAAMAKLAANTEPAHDPNIVAKAMAEAGTLSRLPGGAVFLIELMACVPIVAHIEHYCRQVWEFSARRRVAAIAARLEQAAALDNSDDRAGRIAGLAVELAGTPTGGDVEASWRPVDTTPYLEGTVKPAEPAVGLARTDGLRLIYPGKEHAVIGEMEAGKSWLCLAAAAVELGAGNHVVYLHFEDDATDTIGRLLALGVQASALRERFRFASPEWPVTPAAWPRLLDPAPSLVILDGVNECMALHGWAPNDVEGAAAFRRWIVRPCLRVGAATLAADHIPKDKEQRGRFAMGSIHKGNGLSGALILLENADPFGRDRRGRSHVFATKDRPGHLRRHGTSSEKQPGKTYLGELVVDATLTRRSFLDLKFYAPKKTRIVAEPDVQQRPASEQSDDDDTVFAVVADLTVGGGEASTRALREAAGIAKDRTAEALERLVLAGRLTVRDGPRRSRLFAVRGLY